MNAGRKREFDRQQALDQATRVFWASGYSGTSVNDLSAALGINKPSLYAAFGNKEQLFRSALNHYLTDYGAPIWQRLIEPPDAPLAVRLRAYLRGILDLVSSSDAPPGCLFVNSACESGSHAMPGEIAAALREHARVAEARLVGFLRDEQSSGELAAEADVQRLARYLLSVMYGLAVLVQAGNTGRSLQAVADLAVDAVPVAARVS